MNSDPKKTVVAGAAWLAALGVLMILIGVSATIIPLFSSNSVTFIFAWVFLIGGFVRITQAFRSPASQNFLLSLVIGILYIVLSILVFSAIVGTAIPLRYAIASVLILEGLLESVLAARMRGETKRTWGFVSGIVSIVLGVATLAGVAGGIGWLLGLFVGLSFAATGVWFLVLSSGIRRAADS